MTSSELRLLESELDALCWPSNATERRPRRVRRRSSAFPVRAIQPCESRDRASTPQEREWRTFGRLRFHPGALSGRQDDDVDRRGTHRRAHTSTQELNRASRSIARSVARFLGLFDSCIDNAHRKAKRSGGLCHRLSPRTTQILLIDQM